MKECSRKKGQVGTGISRARTSGSRCAAPAPKKEKNVLYEQQHQGNVLKLERLLKVPIMKPALPGAA